MTFLALSSLSGRPLPVLARADAQGRVFAEGRIDFAQIGRQLDALEARFARELDTELREALDAVVARVKGAGEDYVELSRTLEFPNKQGIGGAFRDALRRAWDAGGEAATREATGARAFAEPSFTPRAALRYLREKVFWVTGLLSDDLEEAIRGVIVSGLKVGKLNSVIIDDIREAFAPYLMSGAEPELLPAHRLETIVRTNTTDAYNHGRLTEFVRPDMLPYLNGLAYSAILDSRTTEGCRFLDGKVFKPEDAALHQLVPPLHFNCRSLLIPRVVGDEVPEEAFITPAEVEKARGLADERFLEQRG